MALHRLSTVVIALVSHIMKAGMFIGYYFNSHPMLLPNEVRHRRRYLVRCTVGC
jgi:hypothetical protein